MPARIGATPVPSSGGGQGARGGYDAWKILAALWLMLVINMGFTLYGAGIINASMASALHFDRGKLGAAGAVFQWMSGLPGPLVAMCVALRGARFTLAVGSLILLVGALSMALLVHTGAQFIVVFGGVVGLSAVIAGPLPAQATVARWFAQHRARAVALLLTAPAVGGFVAAPLFDFVIRRTGDWRAGWWLVAGGGLLSTLIALTAVRNAPTGVSIGRSSMEPGTSTAGASADFGLIVRTAAFWQMLAAILGLSAGFGMVIAHGAIHIGDVGFTSTQAASALSAMFLALLAGNLAFGAVGDHVSPRYLLALASGIFGVGLLVAVQPSGVAQLYLFTVLLGFGFGVGFSTMMILPSSYFGDRAYVSLIGIILAVSTTAGAAGSWGAGYGFDQFGSYRQSLYAIAAMCFLGSLLAVLLKPPSIRSVADPSGGAR